MQPAIAKMRVVERDAINAVRLLTVQPQERLRAEARCRQVLADGQTLTDEFKGVILDELKVKRLFGILEPMAERLISEGEGGPVVYKLYAQALVENGKLVAARHIIEFALSIAKVGNVDWLDICGVGGRVHKQAYGQLVKRGATSDRILDEFNQALNWYMLRPKGQDYKQDWRTCKYQSVNVMALAALARREKIQSDAAAIDIEALAETLLKSINRQKQTSWECATAAEASLCLGRPDDVMEWTSRFTERRDVDVFETASMLRQFTEIWKISNEDKVYGQAVAQLEAALFDRQGGPLDLTVGNRVVVPDTLAGTEGIRTLAWLNKCVERTRSVGLITTPRNLGSGFLVKGSDLEPEWGPGLLFLTNSHVIGSDDIKQMSVQFHGTQSQKVCPVVECLCSSSPDAFDFAVLKLADLPEDALPSPVKSIAATDSSTECVYVMGHPDAGDLSITLYDNALVTVGDRTMHYTAATKPGSSGSPVFNADWDAVGLHHGTNVGYFVDGLPYSAHEGIKLQAIMDQAKLEPKPRWQLSS